MKLIFITSLKEYQETVGKILQKAGITVYSATPTTGFKENKHNDLMHAWFSAKDEQFDSIFLYSFTTEESAFKALNLIKEHNEQFDTGFPIRAFILPVEATSY